MSRTTEAQLPIGTQVGDYRILEPIGRGGMGTVYRATQPELGNLVAIKVIKAALAADPVAVRRFHREARLISQLRHPNIVTVFAFGQLDDGRRYYVMELLEGHSLRHQLRHGGALEPALTVTILTGVAAALDAAHAQGIVHRDMKPENIFLPERDGDPVKLLDFGIAKLTSPDHSAVTRTDQLPGSPRYMSPEQCLGHALDHRTDIYALGLVAFECLTGRSPFANKSFGEVVLLHQQPPPSVRALRPDLPEGLDSLFARVLSRDPSARPHAATAFVAELARACGIARSPHAPDALPPAVEGTPIAAPEPTSETLTYDRGHGDRRGGLRRWWPLAALAGLALLGLGVLLVMPGRRPEPPTSTAKAGEPPVKPTGPAPAMHPDLGPRADAPPPPPADAGNPRQVKPRRRRRPQRRRRRPPPAGRGPLIRF